MSINDILRLLMYLLSQGYFQENNLVFENCVIPIVDSIKALLRTWLMREVFKKYQMYNLMQTIITVTITAVGTFVIYQVKCTSLNIHCYLILTMTSCGEHNTISQVKFQVFKEHSHEQLLTIGQEIKPCHHFKTPSCLIYQFSLPQSYY